MSASPSPPLTPEEEGYLATIRTIAKVMDTAVPVPGTKLRVGADALLGLIPGIGDATTMTIGAYILQLASKLGVPPVVMARMVLNLTIDGLLGMIPILGDVFDVLFQANARNARLVERAVMDREGTRRSSGWILAGVIAALVLITVGSIVGAYFVMMWLVGLAK
ncbi:MAG: DUF4112 domain-containing protein [Planctomycetia bacterium]|nr:DUF4112 domain-containing protein [Planctomycetia bacterium]